MYAITYRMSRWDHQQLPYPSKNSFQENIKVLNITDPIWDASVPGGFPHLHPDIHLAIPYALKTPGDRSLHVILLDMMLWRRYSAQYDFVYCLTHFKNAIFTLDSVIGILRSSNDKIDASKDH